MSAEPITVTGLEGAELFAESFSYRGSLSALEETRLVLSCEDKNLDLARLQQVALLIAIRTPHTTEGHRYISGLVVECEAGRSGDLSFTYSVVLRPWLWLLTLTTDFCIYQNKTVVEIVKAVFAKYDGGVFDFRLTQSYKSIEYCTQMFESDFDFVARLLAQEGIYWYFEHTDSGHALILVDSLIKHTAADGYDSVHFDEGGASGGSVNEVVSKCVFGQRLRTATTSFRSYDFLHPSSVLQGGATRPAPLDSFDYYGKSLITQAATADNRSRLEDLSEVRLAALRNDADVVNGEGTVLGLEVGRRVQIAGHWRTPDETQYLLTSVEIDAEAEVSFVCRFSGKPANVQFRPAQLPRPVAKGPMSALVVGASGEEIVTNEHASIKLQFHFDRYGARDSSSSCWVRVSQSAAGARFGSMQIPRIGQEVIVAFLDGNPDQPVVVGSLYNAERMPPWPLPANMTQSGMLSRSTKTGSMETSNALWIDDKKGDEKFFLQAEKQLTLKVKQDELHSVGGDRTVQVTGNQTLTVTKDATRTIEGAETSTITKDSTTTVQGKRTVTISLGDVLTAQSVEIHAGQTIALVCGSASLVLHSNGTIALKGTNVSINGSEVFIDGDLQVAVKGGKVMLN